MGDVDESLGLNNWDCGSTAALGVLNTVSETEIKFDHKDIQMHDFHTMSTFLNNNGFPNKIIKNASLNDLNPKNTIIPLVDKSYCVDEYCFSNINHFWIYQGTEKDPVTRKDIILVNDSIANSSFNELNNSLTNTSSKIPKTDNNSWLLLPILVVIVGVASYWYLKK